MALADNELFASRDFAGSIRMVVERDKVGTLAASTDDDADGVALELPQGTPMAFNTSTNLWVPFTQGGANGSAVVRAFLAEKVVLDLTGEVQAVLMLEGEVHRDDINTAAIRAAIEDATGAAVSEAQLDAALKAQLLRELSLHVRGLAGVN